MLRHANCGGELVQAHLPFRRCTECGTMVDMGYIAPFSRGGRRQTSADAKLRYHGAAVSWAATTFNPKGKADSAQRKDEPMREHLLEQHRMNIQQALQEEKPVLIAGAMARNLPAELVNHPLVEYWQNDHGLRRRTVSARMGCVILTRFMNHGDIKRIRREADRLGIPCISSPVETGELKLLLAPLMSVPKAVKTEVTHAFPETPTTLPTEISAMPVPASEGIPFDPIVATGTHERKHGRLIKFVCDHANLQCTNSTAEARRLMTLPQCPQTTVDSLCDAIRRARLRTAPSEPITPITVVQMPQPTLALPPAVALPDGPTDNEVIQLLQEAKSATATAASAIDLAMEQLNRYLTRESEITVTKRKLQELLGKL